MLLLLKRTKTITEVCSGSSAVRTLNSHPFNTIISLKFIKPVEETVKENRKCWKRITKKM